MIDAIAQAHAALDGGSSDAETVALLECIDAIEEAQRWVAWFAAERDQIAAALRRASESLAVALVSDSQRCPGCGDPAALMPHYQFTYECGHYPSQHVTASSMALGEEICLNSPLGDGSCEECGYRIEDTGKTALSVIAQHVTADSDPNQIVAALADAGYAVVKLPEPDPMADLRAVTEERDRLRAAVMRVIAVCVEADMETIMRGPGVVETAVIHRALHKGDSDD